jgi:Tfp pilus assembly protein PilX
VSLAAVVATLMLAIFIAFVGMVLWATFRQVDTESRRAAAERDR